MTDEKEPLTDEKPPCFWDDERAFRTIQQLIDEKWNFLGSVFQPGSQVYYTILKKGECEQFFLTLRPGPFMIGEPREKTKERNGKNP